MVAIPTELRTLITAGVHVQLTTINADGTPQVSVTWLGLDGEQIYTFHRRRYLKVRNMARDPRAVLSFLAPEVDGVKHDYAVLHTKAQLDENADLQKLVPRLRAPYLGTAAASNPPSSGYIIRYHVERIGGVGPWVDSR